MALLQFNKAKTISLFKDESRLDNFIQWSSLNNFVLFDHINSDLPGLGALVNDMSI